MRSIVCVCVLTSVLAACANPVVVKPSKEAQLAMLKDEGYYAEEQKDGRWYVFGSKKSHDQFVKGGGIATSKSYIGRGPGGATVIFEAKDKLSEMTERLVAQFSQAHGVSLN